MVNGLHILIWHRTKKPLAIALSGAEKGSMRRDSVGDLTNAQCKSTWKCHNESPLYNEYILIKIILVNSIKRSTQISQNSFKQT
jgi:hypothetical protein